MSWVWNKSSKKATLSCSVILVYPIPARSLEDMTSKIITSVDVELKYLEVNILHDAECSAWT